MFFLYIFNKCFRFYNDTNAVVQMLQAFQVSELQYPAYTSDYKHGCHGSISKTVYTRQISKSSDFWLYVRSDTLYRKTRITNTFYEVYASFALRCYKSLLVRSVSDAKAGSFLRIDSFPQFGSSVYIYFLTTQGRFIQVKHTNKVSRLKASFVHLS